MTVEPSGIYRLEVQQETRAEQSKWKNTGNKNTHTHTHTTKWKYEKGLKMLCGLSQEKSLKWKYAAYTRGVFLSDDVSNRVGKLKHTE